MTFLQKNEQKCFNDTLDTFYLRLDDIKYLQQ